MDKMVIKMQYIKSITLIFTFLAFIFSCAGDSTATNTANNTESKFTKTIQPSEFLAAYEATPGALLIDVRTKKEFQAGTVSPKAINVDYHGENFVTDILEHDRSEPVFIYCFSGGRSSKAAYKMRQLGFDRIYEMKGGYQLWEKENKK